MISEVYNCDCLDNIIEMRVRTIIMNAEYVG